MVRVSLPTLGCKANQADGAALRDAITQELGGVVEFVDVRDGADVVVVNTCTVTHTADADARQIVRRAHRANEGATIVVTGCYAQTDGDALRALPEVDHVVGNVDKSAIPALVGRVVRGQEPAPAFKREGHRRWNPTLRDAASIRSLPSGQSRPFVKVQDGCDYVCSFCIIPKARGDSRSLPLEAVVEDVRRYEAAGAQEVVLTGIHLGHWGRDLQPKRRFAAMVEALIQGTERARFRISSLEPNEVDAETIRLATSHPRVCEHLHVPLQSGHDPTLARMRRVYRIKWYSKAINSFRQASPHGAWGIDLMVGFPGEDEEAFEASRAYVESLPFTYLHVFPYSPRRGTPAATMPDQVSPEEKRSRTTLMRELSDRRRSAHAAECVGQEAEVLVEDRRVQGKLRGFTSNYVPVLLEGPDEWANQRIPVALVDAEGIHATGRAL
jgi:threonylcarbamoyladenosine tRNA methylthiotransferase MtaB